MTIQTSYLKQGFNPIALAKTISMATALLRPHKALFEAIAFRGVSGALVAPAVAAKLGKSLIVVRKAEARHSPYEVEGEDSIRSYLIIDDQIAGGGTIREIHHQVMILTKQQAKCAGYLMWYQTPHDKGYRELWLQKLENPTGKTFYISPLVV